MRIEVDVSGEDILSVHYSICVADETGAIRGYKMSQDTAATLSRRHSQECYRYRNTLKGTANLRVRLYVIIAAKLINNLKHGPIHLALCNDFDGRQSDIRSSLPDLLIESTIQSINFTQLKKDSLAHQYAYLMRKDRQDHLQFYLPLSLDEIEKHLKK
ncbi:hypothetical protein COY28_02355 [Candidatus Woesearchaeota archaeon CG_4_10_14_0_2_um_filter_57_5]|nr:MAG: hypothetical protein AUJ68_06810 [Candidatus Woesearchaeota archaeon CG1_02_57_44]PIZ54824.1 MAG: hypothetical protein COY28_02355 [Candidatus Woesearchaeota archaeon CG_4_10_14_0_2_um_filter_57_5]